jgi:hypothetical protein
MKQLILQREMTGIDGELLKIAVINDADPNGRVKERITMLDQLKWLVISCPNQITTQRTYTLEDSDYAMRFFAAANKATNILELEDADYKWLMGIVTILSPRVHRANSRLFLNAMANLKEEKAEKSK